jgi:hypothetical protein
MKPCNCIQRCNCGSLTDPGRRSFLAEAVAGLAAATVFPTTPAKAALDADRRKFMKEATRLATESVQKGWGRSFRGRHRKTSGCLGASERGSRQHRISNGKWRLRRTKLGKINRTITTTELNALCDGNRVPLDEREQNEGVLITQGAVEGRPGRGRLHALQRRPTLYRGTPARRGPSRARCAQNRLRFQRICAGRLPSGFERPRSAIFGTSCSLNAIHGSLRNRRTTRMCQPR